MPSEASGKRLQREVAAAERAGYLTGETPKDKIHNFSEILQQANEDLLALSNLYTRLESWETVPYQKSNTQIPENIRSGSYLPQAYLFSLERQKAEDGSIQVVNRNPEVVRLNQELINKLRHEINNAIALQPKIAAAIRGRKVTVVMEHPNAAFIGPNGLISILRSGQVAQKNQLSIDITTEQRQVMKIDVGEELLRQVRMPVQPVRQGDVAGFGGLELFPRNALNVILKTYVLNRHIQLTQANQPGGKGFVMTEKFKSDGKTSLGVYINASYIDGTGPVVNELRQIFTAMQVPTATINRALQPAVVKARRNQRRAVQPLPPGSVRLTVLISRIKSALQGDLDAYLWSQPEIQQATLQTLAQMTGTANPQVDIEQVGGKLKIKGTTRKAYKMVIAPYEKAATQMSYAMRAINASIERNLKGTLVSPSKRD